MCHVNQCTAGGFVDAVALHAHQAIFNQVNPTNAVLGAEIVEGAEQFDRSHDFAVDGGRDTFDEADFDVFGFIRGILRRHGQGVHHFFGLVPRIFEDATFVGHVPNVAVAAINRLNGG